MKYKENSPSFFSLLQESVIVYDVKATSIQTVTLKREDLSWPANIWASSIFVPTYSVPDTAAQGTKQSKSNPVHTIPVERLSLVSFAKINIMEYKNGQITESSKMKNLC